MEPTTTEKKQSTPAEKLTFLDVADADAACHGHGEDTAAADHAVEREAAAACVAEHQARAEFVVDEVGAGAGEEDGKAVRTPRGMRCDEGTEGIEGKRRN